MKQTFDVAIRFASGRELSFKNVVVRRETRLWVVEGKEHGSPFRTEIPFFGVEQFTKRNCIWVYGQDEWDRLEKQYKYQADHAHVNGECVQNWHGPFCEKSGKSTPEPEFTQPLKPFDEKPSIEKPSGIFTPSPEELRSVTLTNESKNPIVARVISDIEEAKKNKLDDRDGYDGITFLAPVPVKRGETFKLLGDTLTAGEDLRRGDVVHIFSYDGKVYR